MSRVLGDVKVSGPSTCKKGVVINSDEEDWEQGWGSVLCTLIVKCPADIQVRVPRAVDTEVWRQAGAGNRSVGAIIFRVKRLPRSHRE